MTRSYTELSRLDTFLERFEYLSLRGKVGMDTFGYDRHMNQKFYKSTEWRQIRHFVIARDMGYDLGHQDRVIHDRILIHHMNPMVVNDIKHGNVDILNPEYLITTCHSTHNAIHYGDQSLIVEEFVPRTSGDTRLW